MARWGQASRASAAMHSEAGHDGLHHFLEGIYAPYPSPLPFPFKAEEPFMKTQEAESPNSEAGNASDSSDTS